MLYAIVAVLVIIADQWVKFWVQNSIPMESVGEPFIPGILSLVNLHNDGAAFSFLSGSGARIPFIILTGVFVLAVIIALATNFISGRLARWSIVLVAAGGLSNCIDRVIYGYVQDMFKTEFINFPVFNVADIFITVFCLIFVLAILFERERDEDDYDDLYDEDDEDDLPRRPTAKERRAARVAAKAEAAEAKASKKARRDREDDEYEAYKAERAARQRQQAQAESRARAAAQEPQAAPARQAAPAARTAEADPFAEWERANARVSTQQSTARSAAQRPAAAPAQRQAAAPAARPAAAPAQRPAAPAPKPAPKAAPAPAPKASSSNEEFSLEDILAEFK